MFGMYWILLSAHFAATALLLKILDFVLPCCVSDQFKFTANFLLYLTIAWNTFVWTKRRYLGERVNPDKRAVLVTGCDSGFGNALVQRLHSAGYHVFASCLFPEGPGAKELRVSCSRRLQVFGMDVTKDDNVKDGVKYVRDNLGTSELWAIVNNAGVYKGHAAELSSMQDYQDCMEVNAFGVVRVTKAFLPMIRKSKGRVVNLTSITARCARAYFSSYTMSKFAAGAFNDCLRQELSVWGVRVISVEPEIFNTSMFNAQLFAGRLDTSMDDVDEDVISDYGADFPKKMQKSVEGFLGFSSDKIYKVVDGLFDAISREHPDVTYQPCRNICIRVLIWLHFLLPIFLQDSIFSLVGVVFGSPKPTGVTNA